MRVMLELVTMTQYWTCVVMLFEEMSVAADVTATSETALLVGGGWRRVHTRHLIG